MFTLRVLRADGLPDVTLHTITRAATIARLLYASPAWWGLTPEKTGSPLKELDLPQIILYSPNKLSLLLVTL